MNPVSFPGCNTNLNPPEGDETGVVSIPACKGQIAGGPLDGVEFLVVAWKPNEEDLRRIAEGELIYLTVYGGMPPHSLTTKFWPIVGASE